MNETITKDDLIILKGLEGNLPANTLSKGQQIIAPYVDFMQIGWWIVWFLVLSIVVVKYLVIPFFSRKKEQTHNG